MVLVHSVFLQVPQLEIMSTLFTLLLRQYSKEEPYSCTLDVSHILKLFNKSWQNLRKPQFTNIKPAIQIPGVIYSFVFFKKLGSQQKHFFLGKPLHFNQFSFLENLLLKVVSHLRCRQKENKWEEKSCHTENGFVLWIDAWFLSSHQRENILLVIPV